METYPQAIRYTTETGAKQTIALPIWSVSQHLNIKEYTQAVIEMNKENGLNLAENAGLKNLLSLIITNEKTESLLGVKNVASKMQLKTSVNEILKKNNIHSTVKPTKLMQYLVRLVTPKGGTVLDPFMGSGSTGKACIKEGFDFVGIELDQEYVNISKARI